MTTTRRPTRVGTIGRTALSAATCALSVLALTACGASTSSVRPTTTTAPDTTSAVPAKTSTTVPPHLSVSLYFARGTELGVADRSIASSTDPRVAALQALVAGPTPTEAAAGLGTWIPPGTAVRGLQVRDGVATVNVSPQFAAAGPPAVLSARLAQVVYTLTAFPNVERVTLLVAKAPVPTFAGVDTSGPIGRSQVTAALPGVLLEDPAVGGSVSGSLHISGLTAINGTYDVQLVDSTGGLLASVTDTAVAGATFSQSIPFRHPYSGTGTIRVFARPAGSSAPPEATQFTVQVTP
jgi:spore germination protein GerM